MDRRNAIRNMGLLGSTFVISHLTNPLSAFGGTMNAHGVKPYEMDITTASFSNALKKHTLTKAIHNKAIEIAPNKTMWQIGEGRNNLEEQGIEKAYRNSSRILSKKSETKLNPYFLLYGYHHNVYGQFITDITGEKGIIRGFDENFYIVYPSFKRVFTHKYQCYGLPMADYTVESCEYKNSNGHTVQSTYVKQAFMTGCKGEQVFLYAWERDCPNIVGGVRLMEPCQIFDDKYEVYVDY